MTSERWQQINTLLDAVMNLPPGEQQAYLDRHCAEDAELRREVTSLLQAHGEAQTFLEKPAREYAASLLSAETPLDADPLVGTEIDGYRILSVLGRGGMGVVYQAEDEALSRTVALKMIAPALARDAGFAQRFKREARVLARIDSAHIVRIHALRQTEAGLFIVMEYVDGGTLMDLIENNGPLPWQRALPLIEQMLTALEQAHSVDIVHRDIKPHNIMLTRAGQVKVTDFGLAKVHQTDGVATVTQGIAGTLYYMSPEQVRGLGTLDHRTDLYSMGLTIYQMLTGALPFDRGGGEFDIMRAIVEKDFPPPTQYNADLPQPVAEAVMRALDKDPEARYQSAREMREAFAGLQEDDEDGDTFTLYRPRTASGNRAVWYGVAGVLAVLLAVAAYFFWPSPPSSPRALLSVVTTPPGATVYLDGRRLDATPLSNHTLAADLDSLALRIEKDGYAPVDTMLRVTQGEPLSLNLFLQETPPTARAVLQITSTPGDARVQINGEDRGRTDANGVLADLEVEPGTVLVEVLRDDYKPWRDTQTLEAGATWTVAANLEREAGPGPGGNGTPTPKAVVTLNVEPSGTVEVEGETCRAGRACTITPGEKQVTFRYKNYKKTDTLTFGPGQTRALTCYFEHTVVVQVRLEDESPVWGSIMADGTEVALTGDTELTLEPGTRTIAVEKFGYVVVGVQRNGQTVAPGAQTFQVVPAYEARRDKLVFQIRPQ